MNDFIVSLMLLGAVSSSDGSLPYWMTANQYGLMPERSGGLALLQAQSEFDESRTFTSVENVCFAINGILSGDGPSGIYDMGDDDALSTNELIEVICEALGKKARIWRIPCWLMDIVARVGGWLHLPLNPLRMQKLTENYVSSNAKIKMALGVEWFPVNARTGLIETIKCFKDNIL